MDEQTKLMCREKILDMMDLVSNALEEQFGISRLKLKEEWASMVLHEFLPHVPEEVAPGKDAIICKGKVEFSAMLKEAPEEQHRSIARLVMTYGYLSANNEMLKGDVQALYISDFLDDFLSLAISVGAGFGGIRALRDINDAEFFRRFQRQFGRTGAISRHAKDPKQVAKVHVYEHWCRWQNEPNLYKSKAAFARIMMEKYEELESQKVIADRWCKDWAEGKNKPTLLAG